MIEELRRTDHLVYVDTALELKDEEREAIKQQDAIDYDKIAKRRSQIAQRAHEYL